MNRPGVPLLLALFVPTLGWTDPAALAKETLQDGAFLVTSPMRLDRSDVAAGVGVATLLGGSFALDRITHNNLRSSSDSGAATSLRHYGDVGQFMGPILGGAFA